MRNVFSLFHCVALAQVVCSTFTLAICNAQGRLTSGVKGPSAEESLRLFLQTQDDNQTTRYLSAFCDLNGDGTPEAIVYLVSNERCGSGGCNTLILTRKGNSWRILANITITRPPIRVMSNTSNGWHSIGVWVQGGGIQPGYEAELCFDGNSYSSNPSVPPARRSKGKSVGQVIIPSIQGATPLY
jgi:hypothetical protein